MQEVEMIRMLVVHEMHLVGNAMANVFNNEPDIEVVAYVSSSEEGLARLETCDCHMVVVGAVSPRGQILDFIHQVSQMAPAVKVVVVGLAEVEEFILQCFQAGAAGYVLQEDTLAELLKRIRATHRGETLIPPSIAAALISRVAELARFVRSPRVRPSAELGEQYTELTRRERQVLELIEQGLSNQEIADDLTIEVGTVKNHVHKILKKLNVDNRQHAALLARQILLPEAAEATRSPAAPSRVYRMPAAYVEYPQSLAQRS
jgi:two-component system, NarL family, nitrate/nitrite response regulator NarL